MQSLNVQNTVNRTIAEIDAMNMKNLKALIGQERFQSPFGPTALQRKLGMSYRGAMHLIQCGIDAGVLFVPDATPHLVSFKQ